MGSYLQWDHGQECRKVLECWSWVVNIDALYWGKGRRKDRGSIRKHRSRTGKYNCN